jgi:hypothetical protein
MVKWLKRIVVIWLFFGGISVVGGGGDFFRSAHEKIGLFSDRVVEIIANQADSFKKDADNIKSFVKEVTAKDETKEQRVF